MVFVFCLVCMCVVVVVFAGLYLQDVTLFGHSCGVGEKVKKTFVGGRGGWG